MRSPSEKNPGDARLARAGTAEPPTTDGVERSGSQSVSPLEHASAAPSAVGPLLRILILEDNVLDAELEVEALQQAGYACQWDRVDTRADFLGHLQTPRYDLILADYSLPTFDGLTALKLVRQQGLDLPFILVSGVLGEERAIESLQAGATDYVMKGRLTRLAPAVERALHERETRRQRQRAEDALERRTAELEVSNRELEAFTSAVSHDLRNPLGLIIGFAEILEDTYGSQLDDDGREFLHKLRTIAEHMNQLIGDLLRLSHVTRGEMQWQPVDLTALAHAVAAELQQTQPGRQVAFVITPDLVALGDAALLRVALENLLGNAWKYTSKQPVARIEFGTMPSADASRTQSVASGPQSEAVYFVRDNGVGFDMAHAAKLFAPFQRLHAASEFVGTGIGLATVQRIIHRHGGRVWAEGAVGRGATFYFSLKAAR